MIIPNLSNHLIRGTGVGAAPVKILLALLVSIGIQTQAQIITCESITTTYLNISPTTILSFSMIGDVIPTGSGTLLIFEVK